MQDLTPIAGKSRAAQLVLFLVIGALLLKHIQFDLRVDRQRAADGIETHRAVNALIREAYGDETQPTVVYSFRFPTPSFSLRQHATREHHQAEIDRLYPTEGHYLPWTGAVRLPRGKDTWDVLVIREKDVAAFPEQIGTRMGHVDDYVIYRSP